MASSLPRVTHSHFLKALRGRKDALRELKKVDPRDRYVILYPDSRSVNVGMGRKLAEHPAAAEVYNESSRILGKDILALCLRGPKSELYEIENRNLATFVTSHAVMKKLEYDKPDVVPFCKGAGGIGIGLINALVFSGSMTFENGLDMVQRQSQAMEKAASIIPSAKIIVRLQPATSKIKVCQAAIEHCLEIGIPEEVAVCAVSRHIRSQVVEISGHEEAIKYLEGEGDHLFGFVHIRRVMNIPRAYYTELMEPASQFISLYLGQKMTESPDYLREPQSCSVYSATSGCRLRSLESVNKDLIDFPRRSQKVEQLLRYLFDRPKSLHQPNVLVLWDRTMMENLGMVNAKAYRSAKLLRC